MKIAKAKKILSDNGIYWNNYFDLDFVEQCMPKTSTKTVIQAIRVIKRFLITGNKGV